MSKENNSWWSRHRAKVILLLILVVIFFPVTKEGIKTERYTVDTTIHKSDLKETLRCSFELGNGKTEEWSLTDLGADIRIIIKVASTAEIILKVESDRGTEIEEKGKIFDYNETMSGPLLAISLSNQFRFPGEKAELSGTMKIYHEYEKVVQEWRSREVEGTISKAWWLWYFE